LLFYLVRKTVAKSIARLPRSGSRVRILSPLHYFKRLADRALFDGSSFGKPVASRKIANIGSEMPVDIGERG